MLNGQPVVPLGKRPWEDLMAAAEDGNLLCELDEQVVRVVHALRTQHDKAGGKPKGSITVKINMKLENQVMMVTADVQTKEPKRERTTTFLYPLKDNTLAINNPKQGDLFPAGESPRTAPADTEARMGVVR
ncbi:MAG: hypothetical protein H7099_17480 [Gemmatimonadaceae bacterium]|nr:hypothetical protein [Gemmatimonadaceae bacterium]